MRELKFRAWNKEIKKMTYFSNLTIEYANNKWGMFFEVEGDGIGLTPYTEPMQYTGLKDCKGKEIYEDDLLKYVGSKCIECGHVNKAYIPSHPDPYIIKWNKKDVSFECITDDNYMSSEIWETDMEIIGNRHENKDLLKEVRHGRNKRST